MKSLLANRVEILFLLSAALFFWMFTRAPKIQALSNVPIATIESGRAIRRSGNFLEGTTALRGSKLYHLDFLWIPEGETAEVKFENGQIIRLTEKTLMVVKLPFNPSTSTDNAAQLIRGSYFASNSTEQKLAPDFWSKLAEVPQQSAVGANSEKSSDESSNLEGAQKDQVAGPFSPPQNLILYRDGQNNKPINFSFPTELSGTLIIRNLSKDSTEMVPLQKLRSVEYALNNDNKYRWQVVNSEKQTVLGPYEFELRAFTPEVMKKIKTLPPEEQKRIQIEILGK